MKAGFGGGDGLSAAAEAALRATIFLLCDLASERLSLAGAFFFMYLYFQSSWRGSFEKRAVEIKTSPHTASNAGAQVYTRNQSWRQLAQS
jgi:hypothetical protein